MTLWSRLKLWWRQYRCRHDFFQLPPTPEQDEWILRRRTEDNEFTVQRDKLCSRCDKLDLYLGRHMRLVDAYKLEDAETERRRSAALARLKSKIENKAGTLSLTSGSGGELSIKTASEDGMLTITVDRSE